MAENSFGMQIENIEKCLVMMSSRGLLVMVRNLAEELKSQLSKERMLLIQEQDQDRQAYQKLLADFHALEHKHETVKKENMQLRAMGAPVPAPRSGKPKHERSFSNASSASGPGEVGDDAGSTVSEMPEDGSVSVNLFTTCDMNIITIGI
jgi:hypothetical protein